MKKTDGYYLNMVVKNQPEIWYDGKQKELTFDKIIPNEKTNNPCDTIYVLGRKTGMLRLENGIVILLNNILGTSNNTNWSGASYC